jgi:hypothetical protein
MKEPEDYIIIIVGKDGAVEPARVKGAAALGIFARNMTSKGYAPRKPTAEEVARYGCRWVYERSLELSVLGRLK